MLVSGLGDGESTLDEGAPLGSDEPKPTGSVGKAWVASGAMGFSEAARAMNTPAATRPAKARSGRRRDVRRKLTAQSVGDAPSGRAGRRMEARGWRTRPDSNRRAPAG